MTLLGQLWSPPPAWWKHPTLSANIFLFVHQLVEKLVSLSFGYTQVDYSGFTDLLKATQKIVGQKTKIMSWENQLPKSQDIIIARELLSELFK